jgi:hypothetical protein
MPPPFLLCSGDATGEKDFPPHPVFGIDPDGEEEALGSWAAVETVASKF